MQTRADRPSTTRRMVIMIVAVLGLIGLIAGIKVLMIMKMIAGMKPPPPVVVSTAKASLPAVAAAAARGRHAARGTRRGPGAGCGGPRDCRQREVGR